MNSPPAKSPHSNAAPTSLMILLDELIADILSRLHVKTLMQMKCVCKSWKTLISDDPSFAKLHLQRSQRNNQLLLITEWGMPDQPLDLSVVPFPVSRLLETPIEFPHPYYRLRDITIPQDPYYRLRNMDCSNSNIVGSCNGLICLRIKNTCFRLWNPATNTLSEKLGYVTDFLTDTFGYDISTDTYKVVAFSSNKVKVFSLSDNVWRDIQSFPVVPFGIHHQYSNHGVYVSGTINWLAIRNKIEYEWNDITVDQFVIVSLDLATETYRQLLPPSGFVEVPPVEPSVSVLMDCLCFSHRFKETHFVLWKMMEFGVQESWTQFLKISFHNLQIDYGISNLLAYRSQLFLFPLCVYESSNTLIMASNQEGYLDHFYGPQHAIVYNWRDNIVEQFDSVDEVMWFDTKHYVESLISTCRKTKTSTSSTSLMALLDELIADILSRLPVKTLMQIKCVCKSWKTLISDDSSFAKLHLQRSPRNTHLLLLPEWDMPDQDLDCSVVPFPVSRLLETPIEFHHPYYRLRNITIPNDPYYRLRNMDCSNIVGSCNGLICLHTNWYPMYHSTWFRLWNPATKTLSEKLGDIIGFTRFTFGYDISTDTYKVVAFSDDIVKVFSFGDNLWRNIESFPVVPFGGYCLYPVANKGVYVSGFINWLAIRNTTKYEWNDITIEQFVIVSLDLATETYRQVLPPSGFVEVPPVEPSVSVLMDCLCFSHRFKETHFVLWKMMEFGVQESWTQFLKISFHNLQIDYGISNWVAYRYQLFLFPLCVFESRNTLIMASNQEGYADDHFDPQHAIVYNWRDNIVEQITSINEMMWFYTKDYVESLVSTCQKTTPSTSSTSGVTNG